MSITEENIKINDIYQMIGPYNSTVKIKKISNCKFMKGSIAPFIENVDEDYEKINSIQYKIFYGVTNNIWLNDIWFTFRDYKTERLLEDNKIAIYPVDEEFGQRIWMENESIQKIENINYFV